MKETNSDNLRSDTLEPDHQCFECGPVHRLQHATGCIQPLPQTKHKLPFYQGPAREHEEIVEFGPGLTTNSEHVFKTLRGDQSHFSPFPLQDGIGCNGRAMNYF